MTGFLALLIGGAIVGPIVKAATSIGSAEKTPAKFFPEAQKQTTVRNPTLTELYVTDGEGLQEGDPLGGWVRTSCPCPLCISDQGNKLTGWQPAKADAPQKVVDPDREEIAQRQARPGIPVEIPAAVPDRVPTTTGGNWQDDIDLG